MCYGCSLWGLLCCYKSSSPLNSGLFLVASLVIVGPVITSTLQTWIVLLFLILFMTGVLVIVVYFTSVGSYHYRHIPGKFSLLVLLFAFIIPYSQSYVSSHNISAMFVSEFVYTTLMTIMYIVYLIMFCSYIVSHSSAIRSI